MFEIKYNFSSANDMNVTNADASTLRYSLFLGSLIFKKENKTISMDWDWIPLLDFAISLLIICNNLIEKNQVEEEFDFTESEGKITFQKKGDDVKIFTTFSDEIIEMNFEEFQKAVRKFYKDVIYDVVETNQTIKENNTFIKYLKEAEKM